MKSHKIIYFLVFIIEISLIINITNVQAANLRGTIHPAKNPAPIVDGVLDDVGWIYTYYLEVTLYLYGSESTTLIITISSIYDENSMLYIGIYIPIGVDAISNFMMVFRTNAIEPMFSYINSEVIFHPGHDTKYYNATSKTAYDCYTTQESLIGIKDISVGGTNDFICKDSYNNTHKFLEMSMPLNSGDSNGHDIAIDLYNQIDVWFLIANGTNEFCQLRDDLETYEYCILSIEQLIVDLSPTLAFPTIYVLFSLGGIFFVTIMIRKRFTK